MLFAAPTPTSSDLLSDRYRPAAIDAFIGLDLAKAVCRKLVANPKADALMFVGPSGIGKTTMAMALADELGAELHHIASQECDLATIERTRNACSHYPAPGKRMHLVLVDEADMMTRAAQTALLSMLDATRRLPNTVWIFTGNATEGLEARFLSRCKVVKFSSEGLSRGAVQLLADIWAAEAPATATAPNFAYIVKEAKNNIRAALGELEMRLDCVA